MLTATDAFKEALRYSHRAITRAVLLTPGETSGFVDGVALSVASGSMALDGSRNVWRSGSLELVPTETVDRDQLSLIDSTSRLRIERGIEYPDGSEEWVVHGLVQVQDSEVNLSKAAVTVSYADLGSLVGDFKLITPYVPQDEEGDPLTTVQAIQDLVAAAIVWDDIPGWDIDSSIDTAVFPVDGTVFTGDRWAAVQALSESLGAVTYAKPDGRWAIRSTALDMDTPVAEFATGPGGVVVDVARSRSRSDEYNAVSLRWESPTVGGVVFLVDADPLSPTYWDGPFGRKPADEVTNDLIATEEQAIDAATALLDQYRGRARSLSFTSVHNPLLEPLDVFLLSTPDALETHVVDSIDYGYAAGAMNVKTRLLRTES
jgi:hypothetical protein